MPFHFLVVLSASCYPTTWFISSPALTTLVLTVPLTQHSTWLSYCMK